MGDILWRFITVKIMILSCTVTVPLPSRYHFDTPSIIVTLKSLTIPQRPSPFPTVPHRSPPSLIVSHRS